MQSAIWSLAAYSHLVEQRKLQTLSKGWMARLTAMLGTEGGAVTKGVGTVWGLLLGGQGHTWGALSVAAAWGRFRVLPRSLGSRETNHVPEMAALWQDQEVGNYSRMWASSFMRKESAWSWARNRSWSRLFGGKKAEKPWDQHSHLFAWKTFS